MKKYLSLLIIITMIITLIPSYATERVEDDITGHWAEATLRQWQDKELIKGYLDGTFRPDNDITKAEFITLVNRIYGYYEEADENYTDVSESLWYSLDCKIAKANGYMDWYQGDSLNPIESILRQDVFAILATIMQVEATEDLSAIDGFTDKEDIPNWCVEYIDALVTKGYIKGNPDKTVEPQDTITRAEAVIMLDRVMGELINESGTYGIEEGAELETIAGNLTVNIQDVILQNMIIEGDLILAAGIGDGDIDLNNVTVNGRTIINGGGENSITITGSNLGEIRVYKIDGQIRVVLAGSEVESVILQSGGKLEGEYNGVVIIIDPEDGQEVILEGNFESIVVDSEVKIQVMDNSSIEEITFNAAAEVIGKGKINKVLLNIDGVKIEQKVKEVIVGIDTSGVKEDEPPSGGTSGGGGLTLEDNKAPTIISYTPTNNATDIAVDGDIEITFDENIQVGNGGIKIIKEADDSILSEIDAADTRQISINNNRVVINPTINFQGQTQYYVLIDQGAFVDTATTPNEYAGIIERTIWTFTTGEDNIAPIVISYKPADNEEKAEVNEDIEITFNETVQGVSGKNIEIYRADTPDTPVELILVDHVTISNNIVTINPNDFVPETEYYIKIDQGAFIDKAPTPNEFAGITDETAWNFTTKETTPPTYNSEPQAQEGDNEGEIKFTVEINEDGNVYYILTDLKLSIPSAEDIKDGKIIAKTGNQNILADTELTITVQNLLPDRVYYIYLVAEDASGNFAAVKGLTVLILKLDQGDGTANPYKIWYVEDLEKVATGTDGWDADKAYILMRDLDFSDNKSYRDPENKNSWEPKSFSGSFAGNDKTISNLKINSPSEGYIGLFSGIESGASVTDLGVLDVNIIGDVGVGGIAGTNVGTITNSYSTGDITAYRGAGGIAGYNGGTITNSYSKGDITADDMQAGGIAGWNPGTITNSYSKGEITADMQAGGIAGYNERTITNSYSTGDITANNDFAGGIAGYNERTITNSYSTGDITANNDFAGGIAGGNYGTITSSYSKGDITASGGAGGIAGYNDEEETITNSYSIGDITVFNYYAGGIVGFNCGTITNNCAYNNKITGHNVNRVVGYNGTSANLTNNYAKSNMLVNGNTQSGTHDSVVGADIDTLTDTSNPPLNDWDFISTWELLPGAVRPTLKGVGNDNGL